MTSYKDLIVWQQAMDLVAEVYQLTKKLPKEEVYALTSQMHRAAVSVPSNIAEGKSRSALKEYVHFLSIARGSCGELATQILICVRLGYISQNEASEALRLCENVGAMLFGLIRRLSVKV